VYCKKPTNELNNGGVEYNAIKISKIYKGLPYYYGLLSSMNVVTRYRMRRSELPIESESLDLLHLCKPPSSMKLHTQYDLADIKVVMDLHGILHDVSGSLSGILKNKLKKLSLRKFLSKVDAVITMSEHMSEYICEKYDLDKKKVHSLSVAFDPSKFPKLPSEHIPMLKRSLFGSTDNYVIMYVGHISKMHGSISMMKAFSSFKKMIDQDAHLHIITGEPESDTKEEFWKHVQTTDDVSVHNPIPSYKAPFYMAAADVLLSPYTDNTLSNMIVHLKSLEYAASGTAVVATSTYGQKLLFKEVSNARLVSPNSPFEMASAIRNLALRYHSSVSYQDREILENYTFSNITDDAISIYKNVIGE